MIDCGVNAMKNETVETELKNFILSKYKSILDFSKSIGLPYSTVDNMLKRGVNNVNISTIIKVCHALGITVDGLSVGQIIAIPDPSDEVDVSSLSEKEAALVLAYRNNPAMREAVDKLLGIN